MQYPNFSGLTVNMKAPAEYLQDIMTQHVPNFIDTVNERIHEPIVQKMCRIALITWFIFSLLRED